MSVAAPFVGAVRQTDSAPLLSDLRNWFVGHVIARGAFGSACLPSLACHRPEWMFAHQLKSEAVISVLERLALHASHVGGGARPTRDRPMPAWHSGRSRVGRAPPPTW